MRNTRWLIFAPAFCFVLAAQPVRAEVQPGLQAVGYFIDDLPPTRSDDVYPSCGSEVENNINRNFNGEPFQNCGWDWFMVHYTGFITIPENETVKFMVAADDGGTVDIDGYEFGTWNLKGCSWSQQVTLPLTGGTYPLDGWFFEAGGGTCYMLAWNIDDTGWEIVPDWAFTTTSIPATTTTTSTVPSTTVPATTTTSTTLQETSTTSEPQSTTSSEPATTTSLIQETSTTVEQTTTSTSTSTSTTTTTSTPPTTTSTTSTTTTTTVVQTTTTAPYVPLPVTVDTTLPATSTTLEEEVPQPEETLVSVPDEPVEEPQEEPSIQEDTQPTLSTTSTSTVPVEEPEEIVTEDTVQDVVVEEPEELLQALDVDEPTQEQAVALATNPEVLAVASAEQAKQIFEALDVTELDNAQIDELVAAVQDAPTEVREAFEETINVFGEGFDNYVPLGSNIPVSTRRTLIAVTAGITLAAAGTRMRNQ